MNVLSPSLVLFFLVIFCGLQLDALRFVPHRRVQIRNCYEGGKTHFNGQTWICSDRNYSCRCLNGRVIKTKRNCNCISSGKCYEGGKYYSNGQSWTCSDRCNKCRCLNGKVIKTKKYCRRRCYEGGKYYTNGRSWKCSDSYNTCRCFNGRVIKTSKYCPRRCYEGGKYYASGRSWTCSDGCNRCWCSNGRVHQTKKACTKCPIRGQIYYRGCKPCQGTCRWPRIKCALVCRPGCACPGGQVVQSRGWLKRCVDPRYCPQHRG